MKVPAPRRRAPLLGGRSDFLGLGEVAVRGLLNIRVFEPFLPCKALPAPDAPDNIAHRIIEPLKLLRHVKMPIYEGDC